MINAIAHIPLLGYSTKTTSLKDSEEDAKTLSNICFKDPYTDLIIGRRWIIRSPSLIIYLPTIPAVKKPINVSSIKTTIKPIPGI